MKKLAIIVALATLGGCATYYPAPAYYGTRAPVGPGGWQTVSVTPVPVGTGAAAQASGQAGQVTSEPMPATTYTQAYSPAVTTVVADPVYAAPYYGYAPVYADPYWYPPVSIGLDFGFGCCRGGHWGGGHWGGGHFGGVGHVRGHR